MEDNATPARPTLAARALAATRGRFARDREGASAATGGGWQLAVALALLIAAGPLVTLIVAWSQMPGAEAAANARGRVADERRDAEAARRAARAMFVALVRRPTLGGLAERLAQALPEEARVSSLAIASDGTVTVDVTAPDPDSLRSAMRRDPVLARLRDAGQRRGDAMMVVSFRGRP